MTTIMSTRTRRTLVATTMWGEFEYKTAGNYTVAGVIQYTENGQLIRRIAAVGSSWASVTSRTKAELRRVRPNTFPSDYPYLMEVVSLDEATAPMIRDYFGRHNLGITQVFTEADGWTHVNYHAGRSILRKLAAEGVQAILVGRPLGRGHGRKDADFQMGELLSSMNARSTK